MARKTSRAKYPWLPLWTCHALEVLAQARKVAVKARSGRGRFEEIGEGMDDPPPGDMSELAYGFMQAYEWCDGDWRKLPVRWRERRDGFVARHMAQVKKAREELWDDDDLPTDRHIALVMWAYSPDQKRIEKLAGEILDVCQSPAAKSANPPSFDESVIKVSEAWEDMLRNRPDIVVKISSALSMRGSKRLSEADHPVIVLARAAAGLPDDQLPPLDEETIEIALEAWAEGVAENQPTSAIVSDVRSRIKVGATEYDEPSDIEMEREALRRAAAAEEATQRRRQVEDSLREGRKLTTNHPQSRS